MAAACVAVAAVLAKWPWGGEDGARVAIAAVVALAFAGAGNARNDLTDVAIDRVAHPSRPLVTGEISVAAARRVVEALYLVAFLGALILGTAALVLVTVAFALMESYERWLKAQGFAGNVTIALLAAAPFLIGAIAVDALGSLAVAIVAGLAALVTLAREVLKDAEDALGDAGARRTLAERPGAARAVVVGSLAGAVVLSPLPWWATERVLGLPYLPLIAVADGAFALAAFARWSPARRQRLAKAGMALALLALLVGRLAIVERGA